MPNAFPKQNKLCGQLRIAQLYKDGKRFTAWPLRVSWQQTPVDQTTVTGPQVLVWAPKSLFKRAVKRNHLRRLMREAYRLHQDMLAGKSGLLIAFNYIDKEEQPYAVVEKAMCKALKKIAESHEQ